MASESYFRAIDIRKWAEYYENRSDLLAKKFCERVVQIIETEFAREGTVEGSWEPLSDATHVLRASKGMPSGGGRLEETGELRDSFEVENPAPGKYVVSTSQFQKLMIHEFGVRVDVTDKMRNFLALHGVTLSQKQDEIVIPERAVIRPAWTQAKREMRTIKDIERAVTKRSGVAALESLAEVD